MSSRPDMPLPSDHTLVRRLRADRHPEAATLLYHRYADKVRALARARTSARLARLEEAEDIVQSAFHRFFDGARRGNYDVPDDRSAWHLLLVIALNEIRRAANFHYAQKRDARHTQPMGALNKQDLPCRKKAEAASMLNLEEMVEALPETQAQITRLRLEGYAVAEIAAKMHRSRRTVERSLQRLRHTLTDLLKLN